MSIKAFRDFRAKVAADPKLQAEVRTSMAAGGAGLAAVGKKYGFDFTTEEATADATEELSDLELELVAGGLPTDCGSYSTHV
jgi:predicted ribosomally synthesized peptide with nif11-like leader